MASPDSFLPDYSAKDPTWLKAQDIAQTYLKVHNSAWQLIRSSWNGGLDMREFIRMLGFSRMNLLCLFDAAGLLDAGGPLDASLVEQALQNLGARFCSVILGINHTCGAVLSSSPPPLWRKLFVEMMTWVEIGYRIGARTPMLGVEGGSLIAFSRHAGSLLLMTAEPAGFRKWMAIARPSTETTVDLMGCEPYQVSAMVLQQLGYGHQMAIGAAVANGRLNPRFMPVDETTMIWKAALLWIEALREGRGYPASPEMRQVFPEIAPSRESGMENPILKVLYTEVAKPRSEGSKWTWHLPKPDYDQTAALIASPRKSKYPKRDSPVKKKTV